MKLTMIETTQEENGNIETRCYVDDQGRLQGLAQLLRDDGVTVEYQVPYVDDRCHGLALSFAEDGKTVLLGRNYNHGVGGPPMKLTMVEKKHWNGNIETRYYLDEQGRKQGIWQRFYEDGKTLQYKMTFVDGKRHGFEEWFREGSGTLYSKTPYVNGKRHGLEQLFEEDGKTVRKETRYDHGVESELMKVYITKYALSSGPVVVDAHEDSYSGGRYHIKGYLNSFSNKEAFTDESEAVLQIKEMREKRIKSLLKQIKNLEKQDVVFKEKVEK